MAAMKADAPLQELLETLDVPSLWAWQHKVMSRPLATVVHLPPSFLLPHRRFVGAALGGHCQT
jgi:hypothetical protein